MRNNKFSKKYASNKNTGKNGERLKSWDLKLFSLYG
jgi:hypothetical protein